MRIPKDILHQRQHLSELQISPFHVRDLDELSLRKLTVVHRQFQVDKYASELGHQFRQSRQTQSPETFTVKNLPELTHLNLVSDSVFEGAMIDFETLPQLQYLAITQRHGIERNGKFTYRGKPTSLLVLSLNGMPITSEFLHHCTNLSHLHLVRYTDFQGKLFPLNLPKLKILEFIDCRFQLDILRNSQMPALKHFFETVDCRFLYGRQSNPIAFMGDQLQKLETVIGIYTVETERAPIYDFNNLLPQLDEMKKKYNLKRAMVYSNFGGTAVHRDWGKWYISHGSFPIRDDHWLHMDEADVDHNFIQTRMGHSLRVSPSRRYKGPKKSLAPLEYYYRQDHETKRDIWKWSRDPSHYPRLSFIQDVRLLSQVT